MLQARFKKHTLHFKIPGGTSRGVLKTKNSWYILVFDDEQPEVVGIGECSIIPQLSIDDRPDFEQKLEEVVDKIDQHDYWLIEGLTEFPAIRFGLETAMQDFKQKGQRLLFPSPFTAGAKGIPINGLIWMGDFGFMRKQIIEKIEAGFKCLKLKIGAIDFEEELKLLKLIRNEFSERDLELRVDANGAFLPETAMDRLNSLSAFKLHSIEQPIKQGQWKEMARLCKETPLPIALDEELIGITEDEVIVEMLDTIEPQFIILKPGLLGGFAQSQVFIEKAKEREIDWWITSALEGNIGLNAIAQWTATLDSQMYQGLGTGQVFSNNIPSPLFIKQASLFYDPDASWDLKSLLYE
jgi:o-succinylbenzoate synthase